MTAVIVLTVTERKKNNNLGWIFKKKKSLFLFFLKELFICRKSVIFTICHWQ